MSAMPPPAGAPVDLLALVTSTQPWSPAANVAMTLAASFGARVTGCFVGPSLRTLRGGEAEPSVVALLLDNTYTFNQDGDEFIADLSGELTDPSYHRVTLTGVTFSVDGATNKVKFTCDPFTFPDLDDVFRHVVYAVATGSDATSPLIKCTTYDTDKTATVSDVTITPHANGLGDAAAA